MPIPQVTALDPSVAAVFASRRGPQESASIGFLWRHFDPACGGIASAEGRRLTPVRSDQWCGARAVAIPVLMETSKAAVETQPTRRAQTEGTATAHNFSGQGQRVLVDLCTLDGHNGTALGTVRGSDDNGRVVSAWWGRGVFDQRDRWVI